MNFGEKLKKLRKDNGLTQEQLAEKLYVTRTAVSKRETGNGYPAIDSLKMISELFGISIDELISDGDVENKRLLEKRISGRFYAAAVVCLSLSTLFSLLAYFLKNEYLTIGAGAAAVGYVICAYFTKPKYKRFAAKKLVVAYVVSRIVVLAFSVGIMVVTIMQLR